MSSHNLELVVFVGFPVMIMTLLAHIIPLPSLQMDSQSVARCLTVDLCICFYQLLDEGSMMTVMVVTNLNTGQGQFRLPLHYC